MKWRAVDRRRMAATVVVLVVIAGSLGAAYYYDLNLPYWHFRTVKKDAFYRTSQLDGDQLREAIDDYGIKTIINLRHASERKDGSWYDVEKSVAESRGVRLLDISLEAGTAPSPEQIEILLEVMDDPANLPVLAHCYHGSIRSAAAEGLFRREYLGEDGPRALRRVESWGRDLAMDYPEIANFIKSYVPRRDRKSNPPKK